MRKQIESLKTSGLSAYKISKETNITLSVVQKIMNGTSKLDNISLKNAEKLSSYWESVDLTKTMEILTVGNKDYYTFPAEYFESEKEAEKQNYYWDEEISRWSKEILNNSTTIF